MCHRLKQVAYVHERHSEDFFMCITINVGTMSVLEHVFIKLAESAIGRLSFERPRGEMFSVGVWVSPPVGRHPPWALRLFLGRFVGDFRSIPSVLRCRVVFGFSARLWGCCRRRWWYHRSGGHARGFRASVVDGRRRRLWSPFAKFGSPLPISCGFPLQRHRPRWRCKHSGEGNLSQRATGCVCVANK